MKSKNIYILFGVFISCAGGCITAASADDDLAKLQQLSLEEMLEVKVTSVSKKPEEAVRAPASVYVITQEDIHRSGLTTIPEILRLAPTVQVARLSSNKWAISTRGFNDQLATKMLVLIDGRSVYTPLFSGVNWDEQDTLIEDIDRIEVISGSGATLWGANAVNGVINIITKNSKDTQGQFVTGTYGTEERGAASARTGGKISDDTYYRTYAKRSRRDQTVTLFQADNFDNWDMNQAGFRLDSDLSPTDTITVQGDNFSGNQNRELALPVLTAPTYLMQQRSVETRQGANILTRWNHKYSETSRSSLQGYYDYIKRDNPTIKQERSTWDINFEHYWNYNVRNEISWGTGLRYLEDNLGDSVYIAYNPDQQADKLFSSFLQDKIALVPEELFLTLGSKFEHNDYTGFEFQPNARLAWHIDEISTMWGAIGRSVRTPNRSEDGVAVVVGNLKPGFVKWIGNPDFQSEELVSYEIGYRTQVSKKASADATLFYNDYTSLRSYDAGATFIDSSGAGGLAPHPVRPLAFGENNGYGETYGLEVNSKWDATANWQLTFGYTFTDMNLHKKAGSTDFLLEGDEGKTAKNRFNFYSHLKLRHDLELNNAFYYIDNLPATHVPAYTRMDANLQLQVLDGMTISLVGQNLLDDYHQEFSAPLQSNVAEFPRTFYVKVSLSL